MTGTNPNDWQRLEAILDQVLEAAPEARAALLEEICGNDSELREEVEVLLAADAQAEAGGFLGAPAPEYAATLIREVGDASIPPKEDRLEGKRIGPYQIVQQIGSGGMGAVFLAQRADGQFDQHVALKIVRRDLDTQELLQRFLQERQILARFEHPNIARLLDGGVTQNGVPYFAMEYVKGTQITHYADAKRFSIDERLRLFLDVCGAVHYAHRNLIVHRDLKPSNILVTEEGQIKLLDFGIAKPLGPEVTEESASLTRAGERVMTPAYAAPEQVRGDPVTTAADVYSLGVTLFELLTGHLPVNLGSKSGSIDQAILEEEPVKPSWAVKQRKEARKEGAIAAVTPESVGRARNTQVEQLHRRLKGDLDNILLMALRKEPDRRYSSAEAFAEDIRRNLAGWPVTARKDTLGYRMHKFVLRNSIGVAAGSLILLSLLLGLGGTAWQARVASQEAGKLAEVKGFLVSLFEISDPDESKGKTITARELLDAGADRIEKELARQPELKSEMTDLLADVYQKLGAYERAETLSSQSLAMWRSLYGEEHPRVAESLSDIGLALRHRGQYDEAERRFREALEMRGKLLGEEHPDYATSLFQLGLLLEEKGQYQAAEPLLQKSLLLRRKLLGDEHIDVAASLSSLASFLNERGTHARAEELFRESLRIRRKLLGNEHSEVAKDLNNLAELLRDKDDLVGAEALVREALKIYRGRLGEDHPNVIITLQNLASLLHSKGNYEEAKQLYQEALASYSKLHGKEHPTAITVVYNLASLEMDKHNHEEAVALFRGALKTAEASLGDQHPIVAAIRNRIGIGLLELSRPFEAQVYLEKAHSAYRVLYPEGDRRTIRVLAALGSSLLQQGKADKAEPLLYQALTGHLERFGASDRRTAELKMHLGVCLMTNGRLTDAQGLLREAHAVLGEKLGHEHPLSRRAKEALTEVQTRQSKTSQSNLFRELPITRTCPETRV